MTDKESSVQGVDEFAKYAPKLPPHYETCSFLRSVVEEKNCIPSSDPSKYS
jgi:hypothetical protein